ncbi:glycosyltransferase family 4 protein [Candidatus Nomurabacteria bacterium]|nr:glycosyltransferase family 4 protein [Candidatus Nomurabacteria bacterium]
MIKRILDDELFVHENGKIYTAPKTSGVDNKKYTIAIVIDTVVAIPPTTGVTYRLYYLSKELIKRGHKILWILGNRNFKTEESLNELSKSGIKIHLLPPDIFYDADYLSSILIKEKVEIVQYEITQTFLALGLQIRERTKLPTLLELHDVEATLRDTLDRGSESPVMKFLQYAAGVYADAIISMTPLDYNTLVKKIGVQKTKMVLVPNGVSINKITPSVTNKSENTLLFLGNLFYPPNQKGFQYIADEIMPELASKRDVTLKSIGMVPEDLVTKYSNRSDIIILREIKNEQTFVDEVSSSTIGLCTVFAGSGMKIKILDYCLSGLPVISTTIGASGYEEVDSLIIKNSKQKIIKAIEKLLDNSSAAQEIGQKNQEKILNLYGWPKIAEKFETALSLANDFNLRRFKEVSFQPFWMEENRHAVDIMSSHFLIDNEVVHKYEK